MTADMLDEGSGERSAIEMHQAIARLGTQLETDIGSDAAVAGLTSIIEPLIIGFLGIVVGGIMICLFMPIFKLASVVQV